MRMTRTNLLGKGSKVRTGTVSLILLQGNNWAQSEEQRQLWLPLHVLANKLRKSVSKT